MKKRFSIVLVVAMIQLVCVSTSFAAPIHAAARAGDTAEVTRLIAEDRANLEARNQYGETPLHFAAWKGHLDIVQALIASGANVNAVNDFRRTPLHWAAERGHIATVQTLIAHGANVNAANAGGTPLQIAQEYNHAATVAALQPEAVAQVHTQTADVHTASGNHALAARSHTWAAEALPGTPEAIASHALAAESHTAAGDHGAAARSFILAGNHAQAAESHTRQAHAQAAAGDFASAIAARHLAQAAHTALGNHEAAGLNHRLATLLAPAIPTQGHLASAHKHSQAMETHFRTAVAKSGEMRSHRDLGDEDAALLAEEQASHSLSEADSSEANAISALEAALASLDVALEGAMRAREDARVANAPVEHLAQHAALEDSLRRHAVSVSAKIDETRANAEAGRERVSAARGI